MYVHKHNQHESIEDKYTLWIKIDRAWYCVSWYYQIVFCSRMNFMFILFLLHTYMTVTVLAYSPIIIFFPRKLHSPILIIIYSISHSIFLSLFPFSSTVHIRVIASMDTPVCSAKRIGMNATRIHARTVVHASTASHNTIAVVQMDLLVSIAASILFHLHMFVCDSV